MAFTVTSISPEVIPGDGGRVLTITGSFEMLHRYRVHVGDVGSTVDPACYSGVRGQGDVVYPTNATTLVARIPLLRPTLTDYTVLVVDLDTFEAHLLAQVLTVVSRQFYSLVYAYRKTMHEGYKVGSRSIEVEAQVDEDLF